MTPHDTQSLVGTPSSAHGEGDEWIGAERIKLTGLASGCAVAFAGSVVTCALLVMNGALVMALLATAATGGVNWLQEKPSLSQFILFSLPIFLTIVQWMMIDTLRWILRRRKS